MSTPQPPYGGHYQPSYGGPVPPAYRKPVPRRRRPRGWWWVVAVAMLLGGVAVGVLLVVQSVRAFTETDATIEADGQPRSVVVATDRDRMIWVRPDQAASCRIVDAATGQEIAVEGLGSTTFTKSGGSGSWEGAGRFDPGSGDLEVTCEAGGSPAQIGPAPELGSFVGGLAAGILLVALLGGGGLVLLIVLVVLHATGRPRDVPPPA